MRITERKQEREKEGDGEMKQRKKEKYIKHMRARELHMNKPEFMDTRTIKCMIEYLTLTVLVSIVI